MNKKLVLLLIGLFIIAGCNQGKDQKAEKAAILSKQAEPTTGQAGNKQPIKMIQELPGKAQLPPAPISGPVTTQKGVSLIVPDDKQQQPQANGQQQPPQQQGQGSGQQQNNDQLQGSDQQQNVD